jgi:hypothetical protein
MQTDPAVWSRAFARQLGALLGVAAPDVESSDVPVRDEAEALLGELAEAFRRLPLQQWNWVEHLTRSLVDRAAEQGPACDQGARPAAGCLLSERLDKLREVRSYAAFLLLAHGYPQPADESDEWSEEDRRDLQLAARKRLDEEDPYPWPEGRTDAQPG